MTNLEAYNFVKLDISNNKILKGSLSTVNSWNMSCYFLPLIKLNALK